MSTVDQPRAPKPPSRVSRRELIAVLAVAGLALVFAVSAIAVALTALGWAAGARSEVRVTSQAVRHPAPAALAPTPGGGAADPSPTPSPESPSPVPPSPSASAVPAYAATPLKLEPSCTETGRPIDLDGPKVGVMAGSDLGYHGCDGSELSFSVAADAQASTVRSGRASVQDCTDAIRVGGGAASIEPLASQSLCVLTSGDAVAGGAHYVLLHIDDIAEDGTIDATATAWTAPG
jgi:hypothetical protein